MAICDTERRVRTVKFSGKPIAKPQRLPWPRAAEDDPKIQLGVDVVAKRPDIIKIVHKFFRVNEISMEDLLQEVFLAVIHKNHTRSAHDPRKSSFGHYVFMVANNVCINLVHRKQRYDKERESIDTPHGEDSRSLLETIEAAPEEETDLFNDHMEEIESIMRQRGMWDLARYVRAARSGAAPNVIREALSWGDRNITNKHIREIRLSISEFISQMAG